MNRRLLKHICKAAIVLFVITTTGFAQDSTLQQQYLREPVRQHSFDKETWTKSTKDLDYSDQRPPKKEKKPAAARELPSFSFSEQTIRLITFTVLFVVLIVILLKVFGVNVFVLRKKKEKEEFTLEDFSDKIPESALEKLLREALERRDFRMAIRIYYLMAIKLLSEKKLISWQKEKTNFAYLNELRGNQQYDGFRKATLVFERTWYGERAVDETYFVEARRDLKGLLDNLK